MATSPSPSRRPDDPSIARSPLHVADAPPPVMSQARPPDDASAPAREILAGVGFIALLGLIAAALITGSNVLLLALVVAFVALTGLFAGRGLMRLHVLATRDEPASFLEWARALLEALAGPALALLGALLALVARWASPGAGSFAGAGRCFSRVSAEGRRGRRFR